MSNEQYLSKMKCLQNFLLKYIERNDNLEENYLVLISFTNDQEIFKNKNGFKLILYLINNISQDHERNNDFFDKLEKLLIDLRENIKKYLENDEIYYIFRYNKRILLFLFTNKMIEIDQYIIKHIKEQDLNYFFIEIEPFIDDKLKNKLEEENKNFVIKLAEYDLNRKKGVNEQNICEMIRNDDIDIFISLLKQTDLSLKTKIESSIFETNLFLQNHKNEITLIEYSVFYGSVQIFKYLHKNGVELTPSLWIYAVHGRNPEILHILKENNIDPPNKSYKECIIEAIKCHHNEIVEYIINNIQNEMKNYNQLIVTTSIDYYNFYFLNVENLFKSENFYKFCKFDYLFLVKQFLKNKNIDINMKFNDLINEFHYIFTPLNIALFNKNIDVAMLLLEQPNIDVNSETIIKK